ncbi:hypothetical protein R1flu_023744 [Riccia fluitans]|uniref:Uncharacterized protein n=1 Tax=Riccia fluitans TaxID=41844 RepID=A0ABD1XSW9_9MARC
MKSHQETTCHASLNGMGGNLVITLADQKRLPWSPERSNDDGTKTLQVKECKQGNSESGGLEMTMSGKNIGGRITFSNFGAF